MEWLEVAQLQYSVCAAVFSTLHLAVMVRAAAVLLGALNEAQCCLCVCVCVQHITLNVQSFRGLYCVYVTACAHFLRANDIGQVM